MELGALVCTPRQPKCGACPLAKSCLARRDGLTDELPNLGARATTTARRFVVCIIEHDGKILVRQRPDGVVNAQLWEFPNVETALKVSATQARTDLEAELGCALSSLTPLLKFKHSITRYRITLEAFRGESNGALPGSAAGQWVNKTELERLPFTSAHRRVWLAARQDAGGTS